MGAKFHPRRHEVQSGGLESPRPSFPALANPVELFVVDCFFSQECPENLCFALVEGAELSEVGSKLAVVIAGSQQPAGIGLADQLTASPAIVALE